MAADARDGGAEADVGVDVVRVGVGEHVGVDAAGGDVTVRGDVGGGHGGVDVFVVSVGLLGYEGGVDAGGIPGSAEGGGGFEDEEVHGGVDLEVAAGGG